MSASSDRSIITDLGQAVLKLALLHGVKVEAAGLHVTIAARHAVGEGLDALTAGASLQRGSSLRHECEKLKSIAVKDSQQG